MRFSRKVLTDIERADLSSPRVTKPQRVGVSRYGMVASQHHEATKAGIGALAVGGNAVDAAVAAALALGVCEPAASGLGGQTFMLIHLARNHQTIALDGSSRAPHRAIPDSIRSDERRRGYKASTVPSTPRVLAYTLAKYGTLPWKQVLEPAIRLATEGYQITELQRALTKRHLQQLRVWTAAPFFLRDGQRPYRVGEYFRQPILAETLRRLAKKGVADFYRGKTARLIHRDMVRNGGLIRLDDLAQMQPPIERRPVACWFDDCRVMTMPPPGAGRALIEMLNIVASLPKRFRRIDEPEGALMFSRIMRKVYCDRRDRPYDPNYYAQVSDSKTLSREYAKKTARRLRTVGETTHLSVMDRFGNAVALTQSIERIFGSCCVGEELGFLYNNYLMAFEHEDIAHPYYLRPNATPWASVAPTIILRGRKPWLVIGSPGSERIIAAIAQVLLRLPHQHPLSAVDAPRLYCSIDSKVSLEASRMRDDIPALLAQHGFTIDRRDPYSFYLGCIQMVMREGEYFIGVADPRRDGSAQGPRL